MERISEIELAGPQFSFGRGFGETIQRRIRPGSDNTLMRIMRRHRKGWEFGDEGFGRFAADLRVCIAQVAEVRFDDRL